MRLPTDEELELIRKSVLLPLLLQIIGEEEQKAEKYKSSMQRLYVRSARKLFDDVQADLAAVRREMFQRKIKVREDQKPEYAVYYFYKIEGFSAEVGMFKPTVKAELGRMLARYTSQMLRDIHT